MPENSKDNIGNADSRPQSTVIFGALLGIRELFVENIIRPFEAANPDVRVEYLALENSAQLLEALAGGQGNPLHDLIMLDLAFAKRATDEHLLEHFNPAAVPAMADLVPEARIDGVAAVPVTSDLMALLYNNSLIRRPPTSWNDFADPAYAGRVAVADPPGLTVLGLTVIYDRIAGGQGGPAFDAGIDRIAAFASGIKSFEHIDFAPMVASGELAMTVGWSARTRQLLARSRDTTLEVVVPQEGTMRQVNTVGLVAGTKRKAEALRLINYMIDERAQTAAAEKMFYASVNARVASAQAANGGTTTAASDIGIDMLALAAHLQSITQGWQEKGIGRHPTRTLAKRRSPG